MGPKPCMPPISWTPFITRLPVGHCFQCIVKAGDDSESGGDSLPQRGRFFRRPRVEALSRLETELAATDLLPQTRRWFRRSVDGGKELLGDSEGQIPPRGLEDLEDPGHRQAAAEARPDDRVDVPRAGDAGVHDGQRLAQERHLQSVADETGRFSLHDGWTLADALIKGAQGFDRFGRGL